MPHPAGGPARLRAAGGPRTPPPCLSPPTLQDLLPPSVPLEPRTPSHLLCVAWLPAGDLTAGQGGHWDGQTCAMAGLLLPTRPMPASLTEEVGSGQGAVAGGTPAAAVAVDAVDEGPPAAAAGGSGGSEAREEVGEGGAGRRGSKAKRTGRRPPAEWPHELRWSVVPAAWGWVMGQRGGGAQAAASVVSGGGGGGGDAGAADGGGSNGRVGGGGGLRFDDAPGTAVHKLDDALRVGRCVGGGRGTQEGAGPRNRHAPHP
jgi:hypothetical protein